ncbi:putative carboxyvinyl-carboxyphosphonate phosphorylmutase [Cystobacter fuscus DSM 2262]|uniref:Carboxyvinyl-carboxyphosphonate phosphorylmutase n=1 Tax=Cystobacter fuscus (strain ATCC 25194 / DSM 2262 / NBRC 100088 / M29) TaxID=1242864 RepID=S9P0N9_CYSF2|nr:isocitrate lyase/phosphoenolpyruvate mutase family protein [Cystobacter fuscus]EPX55847.1 putative carboxyvinyl-carboxyphosphonate phosphorylmutase [Cystobacter fuscus DSM 2262]
MTKTADFRRLHQSGILLLANAWDAGSARLVESLGGKAVATTSAGVAWAWGYKDGHALPLERLLQTASAIIRAIEVPLTLDMERGFGNTPEEVAAAVTSVARLGVAGLNIEDADLPPEHLVARIKAIRAALKREGLDIFINARTDVYLRGLAPEGQRAAECIRRAGLYEEAGADGIFPAGMTDMGDIAAMVKGTRLPVNIMARPTLAPAAELEKLGVRRITAGSAISEAMYAHAARLAGGFLKDGLSAPVTAESMPYPQVNGLMKA